MASINVSNLRTTFIEILEAIDTSGSFADAVSKLSSEDARISTTFSAIASLASLATKEKNIATRFHLGSIGGVLGLTGLVESVNDGRHDLNDNSRNISHHRRCFITRSQPKSTGIGHIFQCFSAGARIRPYDRPEPAAAA